MDVEKTIEFLLQQQAAAEARWAESDARTDRWKADMETKMTALATNIVKLNNSQVAIQETQFKQLEMINALIDADARYAAAHEARSKEIDERLNALIAIVDDLVRRRN
jgi:hypothetical protein